ncbi:MAG: MBL fold metallo-hydrolase [Bacilli bacterium]|nr:MBL fold metallo-hydrolase [Bacilli bacterium]
MPTKVTSLFYGDPYCRNYVLGEEGEDCILVDFGAPSGRMILNYVAKHHKKCLGLLLTHGHFDHICGLQGFESEIDFPIYMNDFDACCLDDPYLNGSTSFGLPEVKVDSSKLNLKFLGDAEEIELGGTKIKLIHTPFHTLGSSLFYIEKDGILFSGDSLFRYGVGRMDLPHAAPRYFRESAKKIKSLPDATKAYPGHGPSTTIGDEKRYNDYLNS